MTLDEAISHCEEVADYQEHDAELWDRSAEFWDNDVPYAIDKAKECRRCAVEHRQLADWLKLLKRILDSGDCNECGIKKYCMVVPRLGEQVRYNCPLFVRKEQEEGEQE